MAIFLPFWGNGCRKKVRKLKIKKVDDKPIVIHTKMKVKNSSIKVKEGEYRLLQDGGAESKRECYRRVTFW